MTDIIEITAFERIGGRDSYKAQITVPGCVLSRLPLQGLDTHPVGSTAPSDRATGRLTRVEQVLSAVLAAITGTECKVVERRPVGLGFMCDEHGFLEGKSGCPLHVQQGPPPLAPQIGVPR